MKKDVENILIVDDEQDICLLIKSILKRRTKAKIDIAYTVEAAKKKLQKTKYDLAFFDLRLNDGTGKDLVNFTHMVTKLKPYIAIISAYTSSVDIDELYQLKINEFIPKPLSSEKILTCLQSATA